MRWATELTIAYLLDVSDKNEHHLTQVRQRNTCPGVHAKPRVDLQPCSQLDYLLSSNYYHWTIVGEFTRELKGLSVAEDSREYRLCHVAQRAWYWRKIQQHSHRGVPVSRLEGCR